MKSKRIDIEDLRKKMHPVFRIAVLGPKGVGKTSLISSFVNNSFETQYEETENDIRKYRKVYDINRNLEQPQYIIFSIEDIFPINHEDIERGTDFVKTQIYYGLVENRPVKLKDKQKNIMQLEKQIYGYVFVYDASATDQKSFKAVEEVIRYVSDYCESKQKYSNFVAKKILVANKADLVPEHLKDKVLENKNLKKLQESFPMQTFLVSAATSQGISQAFEDLGKQILTDIKMEMIEKDWLNELAEELDNLVSQKGNQGKKKKDSKKGDEKKGLLGCGGGRNEQADSDEEEDDQDNEDDEFANVPQYQGIMDDQQEGCQIF